MVCFLGCQYQNAIATGAKTHCSAINMDNNIYMYIYMYNFTSYIHKHTQFLVYKAKLVGSLYRKNQKKQIVRQWSSIYDKINELEESLISSIKMLKRFTRG